MGVEGRSAPVMPKPLLDARESSRLLLSSIELCWLVLILVFSFSGVGGNALSRLFILAFAAFRSFR